MTCYSYHASHEQFSPRRLIELAVQAEEAGFDAVFCSDHLQPWAPVQGHSGHAWTWLGAALQATRRIPFGTITVPAGWRYHPAVLAQSIATLGDMFPGRLPWLAFGSGEALNESAVTGHWPEKDVRQRRLEEGVAIVRGLLEGRRVTHHGHVSAHDARLWVRPATMPLLFGAAMSEDTARRLGGWADGLLTLGRDLEKLARVIAAFREGGGEGKPVHVKVDVCWADSTSEAIAEAHAHWRFACLDADAHHDLPRPELFEARSHAILPEQMQRHVLMSVDPQTCIEHLLRCRELGVAAMDIHHVGLDQSSFIEAFGATVLPELRRREEDASHGL